MSNSNNSLLALRLWQVEAMRRLTVRRMLNSRNFWLLLVIAGGPAVVVMTGVLITVSSLGFSSMSELAERELIYRSSLLVNAAFIHFSIIFAGMGFGMSALREELDDQVFHLLCMQPAPRWIILAGKGLAYMTYAVPLIFVSVMLSQFLVAFSFGWGGISAFYFRWDSLTMFFRQFLVVVIGLAVYSSFFLLFNMFVKNAIFALFVYAWEVSSNFLPNVLKNYSIAFHLRQMLPGQDSDAGLPAGYVPPETPGGLQVFLVLTGVFLVCAFGSVFLINRKPCVYGGN